MVQDDRVGSGGARSSDNLRADVEALKSDIGALRRDVTALVQEVLTAGKVQAGNASEASSSSAWSRLEDCGIGESLSERGLEALESLQEQVEQRPIMSIGIAVGLGMVLGSILRRK